MLPYFHESICNDGLMLEWTLEWNLWEVEIESIRKKLKRAVDTGRSNWHTAYGMYDSATGCLK